MPGRGRHTYHKYENQINNYEPKTAQKVNKFCFLLSTSVFGATVEAQRLDLRLLCVDFWGHFDFCFLFFILCLTFFCLVLLCTKIALTQKQKKPNKKTFFSGSRASWANENHRTVQTTYQPTQMIKIKTCAKTKKPTIKKTKKEKPKSKSKPKQKEPRQCPKNQIKIGAVLGPGFPAKSAWLNCLPNLVFFYVAVRLFFLL